MKASLKVFPDPIDPEQLNNSYQCLAGFSDEELRKEFLAMSNKHLSLYDLYRSPDVLLPIMFKIPCFFIFIDYATYKLVEADIIANFTSGSKTPVGVYGVEVELFNHPHLFDGNQSYDAMMAHFWKCFKEAEKSSFHGKREHISIWN